MSVLEKKVGQIVEENFIYARAFYHLGVDFFGCRDQKLGEICHKLGIDRKRIIKSFYQFDSPNRIRFDEIRSYPLELTLEFLRYCHHTYIKNNLPYIGDLITRLPEHHPYARDLQIVFPLFVEDFITHIYQEEDQLFGYISFLLTVSRGGTLMSPSEIYKYSSFSLKEVTAHHVDEDEMEGIRHLIESITPQDLLSHVIIKEIMAFDREILYHAEIENQIFFPRAISLESEVFHMIQDLDRRV